MFILKNHLETSIVFKGVSKTIQNEILDCLLQIYHDEIKKDIKFFFAEFKPVTNKVTKLYRLSKDSSRDL